MYKVVRAFTDLQNHHVYTPGEVFPRSGVKVDEKRIAELAGDKNRMGVPLIKETDENPKRVRKKKE